MSENIVPAADTINIDILPDKILQVVNSNNEPRRNLLQDVTMYKVPKLLRQEKKNEQEYDPLVVSLGPYHHGKEQLQVAEDFKVTVLRKLVVHSGIGAKDLYYKVLDSVNDARKCYIDGSTDQYDDQNFAQMMLLDACFIINCVVFGDISSGFGELSSAHVYRDLNLLENQIPFWLLKMLIVLVFPEGNIDEFLNFTIYGDYINRWGIASSSETQRKKPILHLLHALQLTMFPDDNYSQEKIPLEVENIPPDYKPKNSSINPLKNIVTRFPCRWGKWGAAEEEKVLEDSMRNLTHYFRSASELKARGIHFRCSSNNKDSFRCIRLKPGFLFATLEVPLCMISMYTKSFFLNMIAYELSLDMNTSTDRVVTEYIAFMKVLIDNPKDVKELREHKILIITDLGNDEDVVKVYKELNTYNVDAADNNFKRVMDDIEHHYNNNAKKWIGELVYTKLRSPWSATALLAAFILLILTFMQTYFAWKAG